MGKVVSTSSAVTIGEAKGGIGAENTEHRGYFLADYERSKYIAEKTAFEIAAQGLDG